MNIDSVYSSLKEMGLNIEDYETFISFVKDNNNSYEEVINKIKNVKEVKDKKVNYSDFEKHLVDYFKEIQSIINKDSLYTFSNDEDIVKFKNFFQGIADKYIIIYKLKDDKDECKKVHDEIERIKEEIDRYNSTSLTPELLSKINDLKFNLDLKSIEYRRLLSSIEESTKLMTKYSNKNEFINLINIISKDMDTLSDIMNNLSLTSESISSISKVLGNITYYFETVEIECINDINRYNDMCVNAGLVKPRIIDNKNNDDEVKEEVDIPTVKDDHDDILEGSIVIDDKFKIGSLNAGDYVMYNGSKSYTDYDNSDELTNGAVYKVRRVDLDQNDNEIVYLEGSLNPYSITLFDIVPNNSYSDSDNKVVSSTNESSLKTGLQDIYRKALSNLGSKNISGFVKNLLTNSNENEIVQDETYDDGLLNMDEFSKIYEEVKGKSR